MALRKLALPLAVSFLILGATFYPWRAPQYDAQLKGFDANFLYTDLKGPQPNAGSIEIQPPQLTIVSVPHSQPTVILASSESSYDIEFEVTVLSDSPSSLPARLTVFFPFAQQNATIEFRGVNRTIVGYTVDNGRLLPSSFVTIANYGLNQSVDVEVNIRRGSSVDFSVYSNSFQRSYTVDSQEAFSLLTADRRVTQFASVGGEGETSVRLSNLLIRVPHSPFFAPTSDEPALTFSYLSIVSVVLIVNRRLLQGAIHRLAAVRMLLQKFPRSLLLLISVSLTIQAAVTPLANHPHDIFSESIWIYTLMTGGLGQLYFRPLVTVAARPFGGSPTQHAVYPYPPLLGYFYYGAGAVLSVLGITSTGNFGFEFLAKMIGIIGNLASGVLVYLIALQLSPSRKKALIASGALLLNPAIIFDAAIWGETDSVVIVFLLAAMLFLLWKRTGLVWVSLSLALLTKQTAIVPSLVIGVLSLRSTGIQQNLRGIMSGLSTAFLAVGPFVLAGYSPFVMVSQSLFRVTQFALGSSSFPTSSPVSADAYSFLPLLSIFNGLSGRGRMWLPDTSYVPILGLSYSLMGKILFGVTAVPATLWGFREGSRNDKGFSLLLVAIVSLLSVYFPTRVSGRYFLIPLALLIPVAITSGRKTLRFSMWAITLTTFISMYALIAAWSFWFPGILPNLDYARYANLFVIKLYINDLFLDLAILLNLVAIGGVAWGLKQISKTTGAAASTQVSNPREAQ